MKKILLFILLFLNFTYINAYENKYFKMDIPTDFEEIKTDTNVYKWQSTNNKNDNIVITISENKTKNHDIKNYTEKDIQKYKTYIENKISEALKEYNIKVNVSNIQKTKINNNYTITYDVFWPTKESITHDIYQKGYSFTTKNYIYVYTYTSDSIIDENNNNYFTSINSLELLDEIITEKKTLDTKWKQVLFASVIAGLLGYIISALKKRK